MRRGLIIILAGGVAFLIMMPSVAISRAILERAQSLLELAVGDAVKVSLPDPANTAFISSPKVASYQIISENELLVFGITVGETTLFVTNQQGSTIYSAKLRIIHDLSPLRAILAEKYPDLDITLEAASDGMIILSGEVPDPVTADDIVGLVDAFLPRSEGEGDDQAQGEGQSDERSLGRGGGVAGLSFGKIINRLTIANDTQVTIKVRVAEISRTMRERLGFQWSGLQWNSGKSLKVGFAQSPIMFGVTPQDLLGAGRAQPDLAAIIDVLAQENLVSLLAEPNLSVTSGETASFLSGGEIPFPQVTNNGQPIVQYKKYGILLDVTPTILSNNRISLRIRPEVSEPSIADGISFQGTEVPGLRIRRADTTIEMASGQSFALAGLLRSSIDSEIAKFPGLADIPLIGTLLRSSSLERGDTELVIVATATIARPTDEALALPVNNFRLRDPFSRLFLGDVFLPQATVPPNFVY